MEYCIDVYMYSAHIYHPMRLESRAYGEKGNTDDANGGTEKRPVLVELDLNRSELSSRSALAFAGSGREEFYNCWIETLQTVLDYSFDHYKQKLIFIMYLIELQYLKIQSRKSCFTEMKYKIDK